jgi:hypothetical protein
MPTLTTRNWNPERIAERRRVKAERIVAVLLGDRLSPADVAHLDNLDRHIIEARAGVRPGSDETWRLVADLMAGSARWTARCGTCHRGDPDGVDGPPKPHRHTGRCAR